jgi:hypothetical protein
MVNGLTVANLFPMSLGLYVTIPKAKPGTSLDRTSYRFLNAVHMDIAFGDCISVGGYRFALILVDCATRYNWAFGSKTLSSNCILSALCLFRAAAGSLACCFYCDCDPKLFGRAISDYLADNSSKVVAAPARCQSSNCLVESHWKVMVHIFTWHALILPKSKCLKLSGFMLLYTLPA